MDWGAVESKEELQGEDLQNNSIWHFFFQTPWTWRQFPKEFSPLQVKSFFSSFCSSAVNKKQLINQTLIKLKIPVLFLRFPRGSEHFAESFIFWTSPLQNFCLLLAFSPNKITFI